MIERADLLDNSVFLTVRCWWCNVPVALEKEEVYSACQYMAISGSRTMPIRMRAPMKRHISAASVANGGVAASDCADALVLVTMISISVSVMKQRK